MFSDKIKTVLIIEDSASQAALAIEVCHELGIPWIHVAHNGEEGLQQIVHLAPDLVLLDLEMPVLDGVQVLQQLAAQGVKVPVVVTSGKDYMLISTVELMGRELGLTVLGGLKKPVMPAPLRDLLQRRWTPVDAQADALMDECEVRAGLDRGEFRPYCQPKVALSGGVLKGVELLARWHRPDGELVLPGRFVPVIEAMGWSSELTLSMLEQAVGHWQRWSRQGVQIPLSVNLSAQSLDDASLLPAIRACIEPAGMAARWLIFEMTESAVCDNLSAALGLTARMRLIGFGLSIDDFGTGFATTQQLTRFPFTELKIDRSMVESVNRRPHIAAILGNLIDLGERLGLDTVAEGIEDCDELRYLQQKGCIMGQGFHIGRPMPLAALPDWHREYMLTRHGAAPS